MEKGILTAIDANLNRALEGLRVCEDIFRFNLRNRISEEIKSLRHRITGLSKFVESSKLLAARDVEADTQKFVDTAGELRRDSLADIFRSNIRRAAEALRALEEFAKLSDPSASAGFQQVRFDIYDIEKRGTALVLKEDLVERFRNSLYAIIDSSFVPAERIQSTAEILAEAGADIIQLRMKNTPDNIFLEHACAVSSVCRERGVICVINDRADIALLADAQGVHLGQEDIPVSMIRELCGSGFLTGVSAGSLEEAEIALSAGADYIAIGPVFVTSSKNGDMLEGIGTELLRDFCVKTEKPVVAIGGINSLNIREVLDTGCSCVALISGLYRDNALHENTRRIKEIIMSR